MHSWTCEFLLKNLFRHLFLEKRPFAVGISCNFRVESGPTPGVTEIDPGNPLGVSDYITAAYISAKRMSHQKLLVENVEVFEKTDS